MKKLLLFSFICLYLNSGVLFGQRVTRSLDKISKSVPQMSVPKITVPSVRLPGSVVRPFGAASVLPKDYSLPSAQGPAACSLKNLSRLSSGSSWEASAPALCGSLDRLKHQFEHFFFKENSRGPFIRSVFRAQTNSSLPNSRFSGTVFKTVYNGKEEVFGVVAAHAISLNPEDSTLKRHFMMTFFDGEKMREFPAEIVQLSASRMLDLALVKFPPEAKALFQPFSISAVPLKKGDRLTLQGFADDKEAHVSSEVVEVSPISLRTNFPYERGNQRIGLLGSPVLNGNKELVGIHTGTQSGFEEFPGEDIGYATHASFLNTLVEAYHNGGKATFPLILNNQKIVDLNVDEYIPFVSFYTAEGKEITSRVFLHKFSYREVEHVINAYSPRYMTFTTRRTMWNPEEPSVLLNNFMTSSDGSDITYTYDFATKQIVSVEEAIR